MYDVVIMGGGLAGLANAVGLSKAGLSVALVEKNTYPFHRVCGEYVSLETLPYLQSLGFDPFAHGAASLQRLQVSSPKGTTLECSLDMGGFGLSRYRFDHALMQCGKEAGAHFFTGEKVREVLRNEDTFRVFTSQRELEAKIVIGAFGKRSTLDRELNRSFLKKRSPYLGVKYHIRFDQPDDLIALHNFKDGYCGISRIEDGAYCLCYLTKNQHLKQLRSIDALEDLLLKENPFLKDIFSRATFLWEAPLVINEVSFASKPLIEQGIFTCGDAAGMIAPLCGNGMAMALHGASLLTELLIQHFNGALSRTALEQRYHQEWRALFAFRLQVGRTVQGLFGSKITTELMVRLFRSLPPLSREVIAHTHGKEF